MKFAIALDSTFANPSPSGLQVGEERQPFSAFCAARAHDFGVEKTARCVGFKGEVASDRSLEVSHDFIHIMLDQGIKEDSV